MLIYIKNTIKIIFSIDKNYVDIEVFLINETKKKHNKINSDVVLPITI